MFRRIISGRTVYVAAPMTLYENPAYDRALKSLQELGAARVVGGRDAFKDSEDWLHEFPKILAQAAVVVVLPPANGVLGTGVVREIVEARAAGVPVFFLVGRWAYPLRAAELRFYDINRVEFARVRFPPRSERRSFWALLEFIEGEK
jgi:hypothetical protein